MSRDPGVDFDGEVRAPDGFVGPITGDITGTASAIADGAVSTTAKLADDVVTAAKTDTATPGVAEASKIAVLGASKNLDVLGLPVSGLKIGASGAEVAITASAAELNKLTGSGAVLASGAQQANNTGLAIVYTTNDPGITPDGSVTFADGSAPTVAELLHAVEELQTVIANILASLEAFGINAGA